MAEHIYVVNEELNERLQAVAKAPYNSVAGIYRVCGAYWDPNLYGDNCIGKLRRLTEHLPESTEIRYLTTTFKEQVHVAAVIDGNYIDPFLSQLKPLPLTKMIKGDTVSVPTNAIGQTVSGEIQDHQLFIRLGKHFTSGDTSIERAIIEYVYSLDSFSDTLPEEKDVVKLGARYQYLFETTENIPLRVEYNPKTDNVSVFSFNCDVSGNASELEKYAEKCMASQYGADFGTILDCFRWAKEMEKYIKWNRSK